MGKRSSSADELVTERLLIKKDEARFRYYALTQNAFFKLMEEQPVLLNAIFSRILVFGRMKPVGKVAVVQYWQRETGRVVAMCGDGGNDS